jgi:hypothetical protein
MWENYTWLAYMQPLIAIIISFFDCLLQDYFDVVLFKKTDEEF